MTIRLAIGPSTEMSRLSYVTVRNEISRSSYGKDFNAVEDQFKKINVWEMAQAIKTESVQSQDCVDWTAENHEINNS